MKKITLFIVLLLLPILSFAQDASTTNSYIVNYDEVMQGHAKKIRSKAKIILAKLTNKPQRIFVGEIVPYRVKVSLNNFHKSRYKLAYKIYNEKETLEHIGVRSDNLYTYITFYISASYIHPTIKLFIIDSKNRILDEKKVDGISNIKVVHLKHEYYSHLIAKSLVVKNITAKFYNKDYNTITINIDANIANVRDFILPIDSNEVKSYQTSVTDVLSFPTTNFTYETVISKKIKRIKFVYYNTSKNDFALVDEKVNILDKKIDAQTKIKPNNSYRNITYIIIIIVLLALSVLFLIYVRLYKIAIIVFIILAYYTFENVVNSGSISINSGANISILPTKNSTVFFITKKDRTATRLNKIGKYYKIKINNKIGWVNEKFVK